jgi:hypothetical protein
MRKLTEREAVARLKRGKVRFQTHVKLNYEHRALSCRACPTPGACCTDAHFVNVHITRLEAVAIRDTLARTPRLSEDERRSVYLRAHEAVGRYGLTPNGDTLAQTFSCPLFVKAVGCLVHQRAKPAPCVQHACYEDWADVPPLDAQWREEGRIERLNTEVYGTAWEWLPLPVWLTLVDPYTDGAELQRLARAWGSRAAAGGRRRGAARPRPKNRTLPVLRA